MMYFILTFFMGAAVGSFVNVLIDRTIAGQDWVRGRSHCDHCHKILTWYDMIPILSYFFYGGKSRCCREKLSYRYPLVETLVAILFVWWLATGFFFFNLVSAPLTVVQPLFWLITGIVLAILALADLFYGVVLVGVVYFASLMTIMYRLVLMYYGAYQIADLGSSLFMGAIFYAFFWLLYKLTRGRGMAEGDMYVAMYMGILLGHPRGLVAMMGSFILGALVGLLLIVTGRRSRKDTLPFVPFMVGATGIALVWGEQIIRYVS
jgi:leader peptidase (prepilin peptidase)/N-methyltransferase